MNKRHHKSTFVTRRSKVKSTFVHKSTFAIAVPVGLSLLCTAAFAKGAKESQTVQPPAAKTVQAGRSDQPQNKQTSLSLVQVLTYALNHNPQLKASWSAADAAKAGMGTAKAAGGLQVNLNGSASNQWGFGSVGSFISFGGGGGGGGGFGGGSSNQGWRESLSVDANLPIYSGGKVHANKKMAFYQYQRAVAQAIGTQQNLIFNTTTDYLNVLRTRQLVDVNQANLNVAKERHRVAKVRFDAGAAAKLEVLRAATDQATAEQSLVTVQNNLDQARANLNTIMGRQPQALLRIQPLKELSLPQSLTAGFMKSKKSTFKYTAAKSTSQQGLAGGKEMADIALKTNPSIVALYAQIDAARASVKVAKAGKKPKVGLSLSGLISNPLSYLGRFVLSLGGSLVQNLFDSGRTTSQVRAARATVEQLKHSLNNGELSVANQIEQSLLALNSARQRTKSTTVAVTSAKEALRAAQLGYSAGVKTSLDVTDAEAALLTAQNNAVNARFDVAASQAQLAAAVGVLTVQGQQAYQHSDRPDQDNKRFKKIDARK